MEFEEKVSSIAGRMVYPPTPDVAGSVMARLQPVTRPRIISRRLAWSLTIILVLFLSLMLIPPARAAILEFIQIGIVRIFPRPTEPPVDLIRTTTPEFIGPATATPFSNSSDLLPILKQISGETTLNIARQRADYPILLPAYPPDLGQPDFVFVQEAEGAMVILVWLDPQQPDKILMSLHFVPSESWAIRKVEPEIIQEATVNGERAIWTRGPYPLILSKSNVELVRLINGNVLIWADGDVTHRLELDLPLEEAIKIAESLEPVSIP